MMLLTERGLVCLISFCLLGFLERMMVKEYLRVLMVGEAEDFGHLGHIRLEILAAHDQVAEDRDGSALIAGGGGGGCNVLRSHFFGFVVTTPMNR